MIATFNAFDQLFGDKLCDWHFEGTVVGPQHEQNRFIPLNLKVRSAMSDVDYVKRESEDVLNADHFESEESDWQVQKELALLNAISKCKPVGTLAL
jgi:hypothetical protein